MRTTIYRLLSKTSATITLFSFFIFLGTLCAVAQTNIGGVINDYTALVTINNPGCGTCDQNVACLNQINVNDASAFSVGDKALIVQLKGATIDQSNSISGGTITDIGNAGNYEFFDIGSISANTIRPAAPLKNDYDTSGQIQLVRVPVYPGDVEITSELQADPWNDATGEGGIIALFVKGTLTLSADINASGQGYVGVEMSVNGSPDNCNINPTTQFNLATGNTDSWFKGGGIAVAGPSNEKGRAPLGNGGGSGVSGDSGGGGGANFGAGGIGGNRWCDTGSPSTAGGLGGFGLSSFISNENRVFFGGAGGAGFVTSSNPSQASNGGGIVVIRATNLVGNGFTIDASGENAIAAAAGIDGGGGGGAGGSVAFDIASYSGSLNIDISGGNGQSLTTAVIHGPGGGGGGGAFLHNLSTVSAGITLNMTGGIAGTHSGAQSSNTNGAMDGSAGGVINYFNFIETANFDSDGGNDQLPDICDLDSDNDGILDANEDGGSNFDPSQDADGDGIPNYLDKNDVTSGFPAFTDANSDGINDIYDADDDGFADFHDLDSDNDGCNDVIESGGNDPNDDGILGDLPVVVDANGQVSGTGATGGYDGVTGNETVATRITIGTAPSNKTLNASSNGDTTFEIVASADQTTSYTNGIPNYNTPGNANVGINFQWQVDSGAGFSDIANAGIYSGSTTSILTLTGATNSENGNIYRIIVTHDDNICIQEQRDATLTIDFTAPTISIDMVAVDDIINSIEDDSPVTISGMTNAEDGQIVMVMLNNNTYMPTVSGGTWTFDISAPDAQALDADETITADVSDVAGNPAVQATRDIEHDTVPPVPTIAIDDITADNILNAAEAGANVAVTGTVAGDFNTNDTVTLTVNGNDYTGNVDVAGLFSISVPGSDLAADPDTTVDGSVTTADVAGNTASATDMQSYTVDTVLPVPTIAIDDITADNILNAAEAGANVAVTGTVAGDFNTNDTVTLTVNGNDYTGNVDVAGLFSISVPGSDLAADPDTTVDGSVTTTDTAGNSASATDTQVYAVDLAANTINDNAATNEDEPVDIDVLDNDSNVPSNGTLIILSQPTDGNAIVNDNATPNDPSDDTVTYTPNGNYDGADSFVYRICDNAATPNCSSATVNIIVEADTDEDGIVDIVDLDDDNDGIPDTVECPSMISPSLIPNGDFGVADTSNDTFFNGSGNGTGNPNNYNTYSKQMPANVLTTYGYQAPRPSDGNYAIVTNSVGFSYSSGQSIPNFWLDIEDYTEDAVGELGYFALFNAAGGAGTFFEQTIPNLTIGEEYEFTTGIINLFHPGYLDNGTAQFLGNTPIPPNISMIVSDTGGNIIAQFDSGDIPNDATWKEVSLIFTATQTNMVLSISNNTPGGVGNDFGIDNISLQIVCDFDNDGILNHLDLDSDNDGILDVVEAGGTDSNRDGTLDDFADGNNDGLDDSLATNPLPLPNSDNNANDQSDYLDIDADDDGLPDNIEGQPTATYNPPSGMGVAIIDANNNGVDDNYENGAVIGLIPQNTDGDSNPDYIDLDSDNDFIDDLIEGGRGTFVGIDSDNDGLDNGFEGGSNIDPTDINDDIDDPTTLPDIQMPGGDVDFREGIDSDGDGINDNIDLDDDNDGISDTVEGTGDTDGDGVPDYLDLDSDNDGIPDIIEAGGTDGDGDGHIDYPTPGDPTSMVDANNDGLDDSITATPLPDEDSDNDGIKDRLDLDADNDGIPDVTEAGGSDTDGDGIIDTFVDADNDGFADSVDSDDDTTPGVGDQGTALLNPDTDNDGVDDRIDVDSDNDGISDVTEAGGTDTDGDGRIDGFIDADDDGFTDSIDTDDSTTPATLDGSGTPLPRQDFDNDGRPNYLDIDADNDGITDAIEAGGLDTDGDGEIDGFTDTNGNGLDDATAASPLPIPNSDGNTIDGPDYLDIDADDDGLPDNIEAQPTVGYLSPDGTSATSGLDNAYTRGFAPEDTDGDLIPDYLDSDSDNDLIDDLTEGGRGTFSGSDTDSDGLDDGFEGANTNDPNDVNDEIDNPTTLPDVQLVGGDVDYRQGLDSDGDGVTDDQEIVDGTNPNDPCDFVIASITETQGGDYLTSDCDGDGVINETEIADGTNPEDPCDFIIASTTLEPSGDYLSGDCDGDGVTNGTELTDGTDPTDPCDFSEPSVTLDRSGDYLTADCDGDQIPNGQEITDGTNPSDPCSSRGGTPPAGVPCDIAIETDLVGPGINNGIFRITNIESFPENTLRIYNRWGVLVFEMTGYDNASNVFRGISTGRVTINKNDELPVGVYFYVIDYVSNGKENIKNGYLYVTR